MQHLEEEGGADLATSDLREDGDDDVDFSWAVVGVDNASNRGRKGGRLEDFHQGGIAERAISRGGLGGVSCSRASAERWTL